MQTTRSPQACTVVECGRWFDGQDFHDEPGTVLMRDGRIVYAGPRGRAPALPAHAEVLRADDACALPGLVDVHTHLAFGNAQSEEDIDFYISDEMRALRGLYFAQQVLEAGYTSIVCPGDSARLSIGVRNIIEAGMFMGPRIAAGSRVLTNRQSLNDWYPSWVGVPEYSTACLVNSTEEAIARIRQQAKDGADVIKIAMDGPQRRDNGEQIAAFTQAETSAMVAEAHRVGCKVATHAYGREAVLCAARAGVDVVFHAFFMDEEGIDAILAHGCHVAPTLTFPKNNAEFCPATEPSVLCGYAGWTGLVHRQGAQTLRRAVARGVPLMTGSDSGFAVTPYGQWHAREIQILVEDLGLSPLQALRAATSVSARMLPDGGALGRLGEGAHADLLLVRGNPLADLGLLLDPGARLAVFKAGERVRLSLRPYDPRRVSDFNSVKWTQVYTRERVAALQRRELQA